VLNFRNAFVPQMWSKWQMDDAATIRDVLSGWFG
jgi:hypothetical protein